MGKFRVRVSGKGKRWKKGQSSSSNPSSTTFRDAARSGFFQALPGESNLTKEALEKHDILSGVNVTEDNLEDVISLGGKTFKTFDTFASDWSQCSNKSFNKLLHNFKSNSAVHKELLAVLAAITEVIKERGGSESSTDYFAALMTALDSEENDDSSIHAILTLLSMGIKSVPSSVLQLKFSQSSKTLMQLLGKFAQSENVSILRPIIGCLSVLLRNQESASWNDPSTLTVLDSILAFITFSKPKVRKAAQHGITVVIQNSNITYSGKSHIAKHCVQILEGIASGGVTATLHVLTLLKDIMHTFPKKELKECCETILKVMTMNNVLVSSCGLQALYGMLSGEPSSESLPPARNARLITALYDYQPPPTDAQPTQAWVATLQQAFLNLARNDVHSCLNSFSKLLKTLTPLYLTEKPEIMSSVTHCLSSVIEAIFKGDPNSYHLNTAGTVSSHLTDCLSYQYHSAWTHILHLLSILYKSCNSGYAGVLGPSLRSLGLLRDTNQFAYNNEIEAAVGNAVRSLGPEVVLKAIPLQISPAEQKKEFKRSWLLPILKDSIRSSSLSFFTEYFLPQALLCRNESERLKNINDQIGSLSYDLLQSQIWSLLPSFSNKPNDISVAFPTIAKALGGVLNNKKDLRIPVMSCLRKLISYCLESEDVKDKETMSRFAKNYLPILFAVYTTPASGTYEEGTRRAAFETIMVYLKIADKNLCTELYQKAFDKLSEHKEDSFKTVSILDLIRTLIPYLDKSFIQNIYSYLTGNISETSDHREQKKYFRLIEVICTAESEECNQFLTENQDRIKDLLLTSLSKSATSSKGARLRCILQLLKQFDYQLDLIWSIIPEVVLCVKDLNSNCRKTAYSLLTTIADYVDPEKLISAVMAGLAGSQSSMACSILALAALIYHYKDRICKELEDEILHNVAVMATCDTREISIAALSFIKVYIQSFPRQKISTFVPNLIKIFSKMSDDVRRGCRTKVRDILARLVRWFGGDYILSTVPQHDTVLRARVRNLSKINVRRKREKELKTTEESDEAPFTVAAKHKSIEEILAESDSEFDDEENDEEKPKKKQKGKTWITESTDDIIDFTDLGTAKKISASKPVLKSVKTEIFPKKKKPKSEFKTAPDGRLIIADQSDSEDEEGSKKKKKKPVIPGLEDSEDDYVPSDEDAKSVESAPTKGRKRTLSVSTSASAATNKYVAGGTGIHRPIKTKAQKTKKGENKGPKVVSGKVYKAKKAGGDMKKKGLPSPYAYVPLRRDALNKRKKMKAAGVFKNFINSARKGATKGVKQKMKRRN